jgi:DNA sulfur modification protein DndB
MTKESNLPNFVLPALRARMGEWIYYICFMTMQDIAARISISNETHGTQALETSLQREPMDRSEEIATYLLSHSDRFLNALVVGVYGGDPKWNELEIKSKLPHSENSFEYLNGCLGILTLSGNEMLFAIDGQNRIAGIRQAMKEEPAMGVEEVPVIFVAGVPQDHGEEDLDGFVRTRQLYRSLNRYAKPVK